MKKLTLNHTITPNYLHFVMRAILKQTKFGYQKELPIMSTIINDFHTIILIVEHMSSRIEYKSTFCDLQAAGS